ncbi:uncharacterized protein RCH25_036538 [Pelodytes ibericus]
MNNYSRDAQHAFSQWSLCITGNVLHISSSLVKMADAGLDNDREFEDSSDEDTGLDLQMHLLPSQRSEDRRKDHCDFLLDAIDEQLDQLQSRSTLKNSQKNDENKYVTSETYTTDMDQSHEIDCHQSIDAVTVGSNEEMKDCKKEEYKWRLTHLLGSEQTDFQEYNSDTNSAESVCTEDFVVKFKQGMVEPIATSDVKDDDDAVANVQHKYNNPLKPAAGNSENVGLSEDNFPLNTARRENILQQFKEELEDDLQTALSIGEEGMFSGITRHRRESVESLGGEISRLSQANMAEPSCLLSLGVSRLSSKSGEDQQSIGSHVEDHADNKDVIHRQTSSVRHPLETNSDFIRESAGLEVNTIGYKLESDSSKDHSHLLDASPHTFTLQHTAMFSLKAQTDLKTCGNTQQNKSENIQILPQPEEMKSHAYDSAIYKTPIEKKAEKDCHKVSSDVQLNSGDLSSCDNPDGTQTRKESFPQNIQSSLETNYTFSLRTKDLAEDRSAMDSSFKEDTIGVAQYKHVAGVPLKSFDTVTVDSDLDSVTTERVWHHIRKTLGSRKEPAHNTRRVHQNQNDYLRYQVYLTDDQETFETTFPSAEWRSGSPKRWSSSSIKATDSTRDCSTKSIKSDFLASPDQMQCRRVMDDLATERIVLEETIAKLRRDAVVEEERLTKRKAQCREADLSFNDILQHKKETYQELESLRDLLESTRKEVVRMESQVRESQMTEEDFRNEVVILEYKRNQYLKELRELELEMDCIKQQCSSVHNSQTATLQYEISSLTSERDELKTRVRHLEGSLSFMERQELERQLTNAKSELYSEQRTSKSKIEKLQENLEESQCRLKEKVSECVEKQESNRQLKSQLRELEKKYETQIQGQVEEANEQEEALTQQVTDLSIQAREQITRITLLEKILSEKELDLLRLRDVISSLKAEKEAQVLAAEALKEEQNVRVLELQRQHQIDKDRQIAELRDEMKCQNQKEIQQFAENLEQVKIKALQDQAESLRHQTDNVLKTMEVKDKDIAKLKETIKSQKDSMKKLAAELTQEAREMVHKTVLREQKKWESEKRDALQIQRHTIEEEKLRDMADLREALEQEHRSVMALEKKLADLQNIIQEHEIHNRSLLRERQDALDELRAVLKEEKQEEMKKLEQELAQEKERDMERLKVRLQQMEEEQQVLRAEKNEAVFKEREALAQAERAERALAREINAACEQMLNGPGRPKKLSPSRCRQGSPSRLSTNQALQMLHGASAETNQYIHELQQEVEAQKRTVIHVQREKERELQQMKEHLQIEKDKALDLLKDRLIQEHIEEITNLQRDQLRDSSGPDSQSLRQQLREKDSELRAIQRNMAKWKDETSTKLARKFEEELNAELEKCKVEFLKERSLSRSKASENHRYTERVGAGASRLPVERRENSHLRSASTPSLNGLAVQHDFGALKILRNLQGRVRELRADHSMYRGASVEDLSMLRSDLGNSYREKRPLLTERCMTPLHGRSMRK